MIVPGSKLVLWAGLIILPFAALITIIPETAILSGLIMFTFFMFAMADLIRGYRALAGVSAELPDTVRLVKDRQGKITVRIKNEKMKVRRIRLGLAFPPHIISSVNEGVTISLPRQDSLSEFSWPCTGTERGTYLLDRCYVEALSPFGFWATRKVSATRAKICVYPDLLMEKKYLGALFLNRGNFGIHIQRQVGQGRDFEELREYIPGDNYGDIHWKATARRGYPITKIFQIERTQEVYVIIDASRLSGRTMTLNRDGQNLYSSTILERFITAALVLGIAAERQGDLFGLMVFSDKVRSFLRAGGGKIHFNTCRELLCAQQAKIVTPDIDELFASIRLYLRRRALLIFLTSLEDPLVTENFVEDAELLCRQHLMLINMVKPQYAEPLFSSPDVTSIDDIYQSLAGHILLHRLLEAERLLRQRGVEFNLLDNEKMCAQLVSHYMNIKQRQVL